MFVVGVVTVSVTSRLIAIYWAVPREDGSSAKIRRKVFPPHKTFSCISRLTVVEGVGEAGTGRGLAKVGRYWQTICKRGGCSCYFLIRFDDYGA